MQKTEFRNLLSYYLDCLEEEDLRALTFNVSQLNQSFVLGGDGSFLMSGRETVLPLEDAYFWKRHESLSDEPEKLFLGFPIQIYKKAVSPVFFLEVNAHVTATGFKVIAADTTCLLNHHLFGKGIHDLEETLKLSEEFECELFHLSDNLAKVMEHLQVQLGDNLESQETMNAHTYHPRWANNFILFRGGRSAVNAMLKKDVVTFLKYPSFIENLEGTALEALLNPGPINPVVVDAKAKFSVLNNDQQQAIHAGLSQKLTLVTGPPGTGKSQVVMNLLATCALNKKTVLFASKNNKAVDVVYEKLSQIMADDNWILRLGSHQKIEECQERIMAQLSAAPQDVPPMFEINEGLLAVEHTLSNIASIRGQIEQRQEHLAYCEAHIRVLIAKLDAVWVEQLPSESGWTNDDDKQKALLERIHQQLIAIINPGAAKWWLKLIMFFASTSLKKYYYQRIEKITSLYMQDASQVLASLRLDMSVTALRDTVEKAVAFLSLKQLYDERGQLEKSLAELPSALSLRAEEDAGIAQQIDLYQRKLRISWRAGIEEKRGQLFALFRRYFSAIQDPPQNIAGWRKFSGDFVSLLNNFYVWIVTNLSARKSIPLEAKLFDYVVIDEASQCDILSALPLLYRARNAIIIGDPNQLGNITSLSAKRENEIAKKHGVADLLGDWSFRCNSIYDLAESKLLSIGRAPYLLSDHYRCHPEIIGFSNSALYDNHLSAKTDLNDLKKKFHKDELGMFWHDTKGFVPESSSSAYNEGEVERIVCMLEDWRSSLEERMMSIGVVTPFRKQVEKLQAAIAAKNGKWSDAFIASIVVGTAHRFQGDECDLVIFSPVIAPGIKENLANWVAGTEELLNVAVTRARGAFHVVGDEDSCRSAGMLLEELANYIANANGARRQSFHYDSPAEEVVGDILSSLQLSFQTQVVKGSYRLDFVVTTPFGSHINLEIDGHQHYTAEHIAYDEIRDRYISDLGYRVMRVSAKDVYTRREFLKRRLAYLV